MSNPMPDLIEAVGALLDGWQPETPEDAVGFTEMLPEFLDKLHGALKGALGDMSARGVCGERSTEMGEEMLTHLDLAHAVIAELPEAFRRENDFWLSQ